MASTLECVNLEPIALEMTSSLNLREVLNKIAQGLVDELGASFARIWLPGPGDLCHDCYKASICRNRTRCLHLKTSAGMYTNLAGEHRRIPLGKLPAGQIASAGKPISTNELPNDKRFPNQIWIKKNKFRCFAGYPLLFRGELLGVAAMFSRRQMPQHDLDHVAGFANQASIAIKNAQLFSEVEKLKIQLQAENIYLREEIRGFRNFSEIIGRSRKLRKALGQVEKVAPTDAAVMIFGETGTGKGLIAHSIHHLSQREDRPLIRVNCAALSPNLIESELFGHEKGAFTNALHQKIGRFELADGGTIFLDEVGDLPFEIQSKLLRILQGKDFERVGGTKTIKVDVRVIAATNRNLRKDIKKGKFRQDLYYRLNIFPINLPPLRERKNDISHLVRHFTKKYSKEFGKSIDTIPMSAIAAFKAYSWPGNIRELQNVVERAVVLSSDNVLHIEEVFRIPSKKEKQTKSTDLLSDMERIHILRVLEDTEWIIEGRRAAAERLGLNPGTLRSRMKKLGIKRPPQTK